MHVKAFVSGPEGIALTPGDLKQSHLCASGGLQAIQDGIWAIVLQGKMTNSQDTAKDHRAQGENAPVFLFPINYSLNSKPLTYTLFFL